MNVSCTVLLPWSAMAPVLGEEGSSQHWPPCSGPPTGSAPAHWEFVSSLPYPKTFMLMGSEKPTSPPRHGSRRCWDSPGQRGSDSGHPQLHFGAQGSLTC